MHRKRSRWWQRRTKRSYAFWALILWSALWAAWSVAGGAPLGLEGVAILGLVALLAALVGTRDERKIEDWGRRKREAEALEVMEREALESKELEREVAELQRKRDRR